MANNKYLTVKEVAEQAHISVQAVYKKMDKDFKPYVVEVENKKLLKFEVLKAIGLKNHSTKVENSAEVESLEKYVNHLEKEVEQLRAEKEALKQELAEEREQNKQNAAELRSLSATVGDSLRHLTIGQAAAETKLLADTMQQQVPIEQKHKRHWWQRKE